MQQTPLNGGPAVNVRSLKNRSDLMQIIRVISNVKIMQMQILKLKLKSFSEHLEQRADQEQIARIINN